ncbi:Hypothetical protein MVR_LOCUS371 [uncultured virus]|nr:Hypothetical protein MVR_LOCUS371 [uncultured virus]
MSFNNILHVFSDNLSIKSHRVVNGIELLTIPQEIKYSKLMDSIESCPTFVNKNQPMMVMGLGNCYHVYITLTDYIKHSYYKLDDFVKLEILRSYREAQLANIQGLTPAKVLSLMKADPCVIPALFDTSEEVLVSEILKARKTYCQTSIGTNILELLTWTIIPKATLPKSNIIESKPINATSQDTTIDQLNAKLTDLQQQLDAAIAKQTQYQGLSLKLMEFIRYPNQHDKEETNATIRVIFPKLKAKYYQNPYIADTTLATHLSDLFEVNM